MLIKNIREFQKQCRADLRSDGKKFAIFFLIFGIFAVAGSFMFFYVEECYDYTPPEHEKDEDLIQICQDIHVIINSSANCTSKNVTTFTQKMEKFCGKYMHEESAEDACVLGREKFLKWTEFIFSIHYTVGWGRVVPRSDLGKILTSFYAIPAIVLTTGTCVFCGKVITTFLKLLVLLIESKGLKRTRITQFRRKLFALQILLTIILMLTYLSYVRRDLYRGVNNIDLFYSLTTLYTTIGFGDIVGNLNNIKDLWQLQYISHFTFFLITFAMFSAIVSAVIASQTDEIPKPLSENGEGAEVLKNQNKIKKNQVAAEIKM